MATTRSRKTVKSRKVIRRIKVTAVVTGLLAIGAARFPVPTAAFVLGVVAMLSWNYRMARPVSRSARQDQKDAPKPAPKRQPVKGDPDKQARDRGWVPPVGKNLVSVSRECARGQHILCTTTECNCEDCFGHDEEKIMQRNREEYDKKFPDEPPF
jgi:hypothetical protein